LPSINAFHAEVLNAPLSDRYAWGGVNQATRRVYLDVWKHEINTIDGRECVLVQRRPCLCNKAGHLRHRAEREMHMGLINGGFTGYGVIKTATCIATDVPPEMKSFDYEVMLRLGQLFEVPESGTFALILGHDSVMNLRRGA
jgi:hypothetical protein